MPLAAQRKNLFPTAAECSTRDHTLRLMRRPQSLDILATTRGSEAYGLAEQVYFSESIVGAPLPIKATREVNGGPKMSQSLERRITADDRPAPRDYVTVPELAALLDVSPPTVTKGLSDKGLEMYRPGGEYGKRRVRLSTVEAYLRACHYSPERIADVLERAKTAFGSNGSIGPD